ncbi:MAG: hypothetical protein II867_00710, partial [Clostridia bacterium]|nr:hypothetical protein [Clostridia bacterium]
DVYIRVDAKYVLYKNATTSQIRRSDKDPVLDAQGIVFPQLFVENTDHDLVPVSSYGNDKIYCVNVLDKRNPLIGLQLYLWNYEVALNIYMPEFDAREFVYVTAEEAEAKHVDAPDGAKYTTQVQELMTAVDRELDGLDQWYADYYDSGDFNGAFVPALYNASPRYYEYKNQYYVIDVDTLCVKNGDNYDPVGTMVDYMAQIADEVSPATYYVKVGTSYVKLQRSFVYRKTVYDLDGKRLLEANELDDNFAEATAGSYKLVGNEYVALSAAELGTYVGPRFRNEGVGIYIEDHAGTYGINEDGEYFALTSDQKGEFTGTRYTKYFVRDVQPSLVRQPDITYVDTDDVFYVSLKLSGRIAFEGGRIYFPYSDYRSLYNAIPAHAALDEASADMSNADWEVIKYISFKYFHGDYVQVTDRDEVEALRKSGALYIWANNSAYSDKYSGVNEPLNEVLRGILGDMQGYFQVTENTKMEIFFEIKLNMSFEINFMPAFNIIVRDLDFAFDAFGRQEDLKTNPIDVDYDESKYEYLTEEERANHTDERYYGSLTHVLGIYYSNDHDTGNAGLYIDLSWLLGNGGKMYIDLSEYSVEDVIGGLVGDLLAGTSSDALTSDETKPTDQSSINLSTRKPSIYINIFTNALALKLTSSFLSVIIAELAPDSGNILEMLPNFQIYLKQTLNPYDLTLGILLYNEAGDVPILDVKLQVYGLNGDELSSSVKFGREEDFRRDEAANSDDPNYNIFYYANFYNDQENGQYAKNKTSKGYVKVDDTYIANTFEQSSLGRYKYEGGRYLPMTEEEAGTFKGERYTSGGTPAADGAYKKVNESYEALTATERGTYTGVRYLTHTPYERFSLPGGKFVEVTSKARYAFGSTHVNTYD